MLKPRAPQEKVNIFEYISRSLNSCCECMKAIINFIILLQILSNIYRTMFQWLILPSVIFDIYIYIFIHVLTGSFYKIIITIVNQQNFYKRQVYNNGINGIINLSHHNKYYYNNFINSKPLFVTRKYKKI
jgi:hypothetical protein